MIAAELVNAKEKLQKLKTNPMFLEWVMDSNSLAEEIAHEKFNF
jgi:hypothetical protein